MSTLSIGVMDNYWTVDWVKPERVQQTICLENQYQLHSKLLIDTLHTNRELISTVYTCFCVFIFSLVAAVEGHAQGSQEADRHSDGCDWQHLSLVHLFALCGGTKQSKASHWCLNNTRFGYSSHRSHTHLSACVWERHRRKGKTGSVCECVYFCRDLTVNIHRDGVNTKLILYRYRTVLQN